MLQAQRLEALIRGKCFRRSTWRLVLAESAPGVALGGLARAKVLQGKHLGAAAFLPCLLAVRFFEKCLFCRGAFLPCLLAGRFCQECLFCRGEARPWGPPHAGAILGPSCKGLTSAGGLFLEASSFGFSRGPTLLVLNRRKCCRSSFFGLWDAESASGVALGGLRSPKVLQAQRLEACGLRKCFRSSIWMRRRG